MQIINNYTIACINCCVIEGFEYRMRYGTISLQASLLLVTLRRLISQHELFPEIYWVTYTFL